MMKVLLALALMFGAAAPSYAQTGPANSVPVFRGTNIQGFRAVAPTDGYALMGNSSGAPSFQGYSPYLAGSARTWASKAQETISILDYASENGCVADSSTNCRAALVEAIDRAAAYCHSVGAVLSGCGTVYIPAGTGCYAISGSAVTIPVGVSIRGDGGFTSCLKFVDTDGLTMTFTNGFGQAQISDLFIYGTGATSARTAFKRPQTSLTTADRMYGIEFRNVVIYGFDTGFEFNTVSNAWLTNVTMHNVNNCVKINGFSFGIRIQGMVAYGTGDGLGTIDTCISTNTITYTSGSETGAIGPEATNINMSDLFGFQYGIKHNAGADFTFTNSQISATVDGIQFGDVFGGLSIIGNYIEVKTGTSAHGIWGKGIGAARTNARTTIFGNNLIATQTPVSATCIQFNESGTQNQNFAHIESNHCLGFVGWDLIVYNPGQMTVKNNYFLSSGVTNSIEIDTRVSGIVVVDGNFSRESNAYDASDLTNGYVRSCNNVSDNGATLDACTWRPASELTGTTLPSSIVTSSLTSVGTLAGGATGAGFTVALGTSTVSGTLPQANTASLTGDIAKSAGSSTTTLATVNSNVGTFGSATAAPQVTVNGKGLITAASSVTVTPAVGSITGFGTGVATALGNALNATSGVAGMTTGSCTPSDGSGAALSLTGTTCSWTKIGIMVFVYGTLTYPATADATTARVDIASLPANIANQDYAATPNPLKTNGGPASLNMVGIKNTAGWNFWTNGTAANRTNAEMAGSTLTFNISYPVQ